MLSPGPTMGHGTVRSNRSFVFYAAVVLLGVILVGGSQARLLTPLVGWVTLDWTDPHALHRLAMSSIVLVGVLGVGTQLVAPEENVAGMLVLTTTMAGVAGVGILGGEPSNLLLLPALAVVALVLHPSISVGFRRVHWRSRRQLTLVAAGVVSLFGYGLDQARRQLTAGDAEAALGHWGVMAVLAGVAVVAALLSATDTPGHRFATATAGFLTGTLGLASMLSSAASDVGPFWGLCALGWSVAVVYAGFGRRADRD